MKTFITIMFIIAGLIGGSQQQSKTVGYKSLAECNNDTLQYILTNFGDNKEQYIGKKVEVLLNDLEFEIEDFLPMTNSWTDTITGLIIWPLTPIEKHNTLLQGKPIYSVAVDFKTSPHTYGAWKAAELEAGAYWRQPYIDIVKDQTIVHIIIAEWRWDGEKNNVKILSK